MPCEFGSSSRNCKTWKWTLYSILVLIVTPSKCHETAGPSDIQTRHFFISRIRIPVHHGRVHSSNGDSSVIAGDSKCEPSNSNGQFGNNANAGKAGSDYATNDGLDSSNGGINSGGGEGGRFGGRGSGRYGGRHGGRGGRGGRRDHEDVEGQDGGEGYEDGRYGGRGGRNGGREGGKRGQSDRENGGERCGGRGGQGGRSGRGDGVKEGGTDERGGEANGGRHYGGRGNDREGEGGVGTSSSEGAQGSNVAFGVGGKGGGMGSGNGGGGSFGGRPGGGNTGQLGGTHIAGGQFGGATIGGGQLEGGSMGGGQLGRGNARGQLGGGNIGGGQLGGGNIGGGQLGGGNIGGQLGGAIADRPLGGGGGNIGGGQLGGGNNGGGQIGRGNIGGGQGGGGTFGGQLGGGNIGGGQLGGGNIGGQHGGAIAGRPLGGGGGNIGGGQLGGGQLGGGNIGGGLLGGGNSGSGHLGGGNIGGGNFGEENIGGQLEGGNIGGQNGEGNIGGGQLGGGNIGGGQIGRGNIGGGQGGGGTFGGQFGGGNIGGGLLGGGNSGSGHLGGGNIGGGHFGEENIGGQLEGGNIGGQNGEGNIGGGQLGGENIGGGQIGRGNIGGGQGGGGTFGGQFGGGNIGGGLLGGGNSGSGHLGGGNIGVSSLGGGYIGGSQLGGGNIGGGPLGGGNFGGQLGGVTTGGSQNGRGRREGEQASGINGGGNAEGVSTGEGQINRGGRGDARGKPGSGLSNLGESEISGGGERGWADGTTNVGYGQPIDSGNKENVPGFSAHWGGDRGTYGSSGDVRYSAESQNGGITRPEDVPVRGGIFGSNRPSGSRYNNGETFQGINDQSSSGTHPPHKPFVNGATGPVNGPMATYQSDQTATIFPSQTVKVRCRYFINREDIYRVRNEPRKNISIDEYEVTDERIAGVSYIQSDGSFGPCFRAGSYNSGQIPQGTDQYNTGGFYAANRNPGYVGYQGNTQHSVPNNLSKNQFGYQTPGYQVQGSNTDTFDRPPRDPFTSNGPQSSYQSQEGGIALQGKPTTASDSIMPLGSSPKYPSQGSQVTHSPSLPASTNFGLQSGTFNVPQVSSSNNLPGGASSISLPSNRPMGTNYQPQGGTMIPQGSLGANTASGRFEFNRPHSGFEHPLDVSFSGNRPASSKPGNAANEAHNLAGMTGQSAERPYGATFMGRPSGNHQSGSTQMGVSYNQPSGASFNNEQSGASHVTFGTNRPTGSGYQNQYTAKEGGDVSAGQESGNNNEEGISTYNLGPNSGTTNSQGMPNRIPLRPHLGTHPPSNGPQGSHSESTGGHHNCDNINYHGNSDGKGSINYNQFSQNGDHRRGEKEGYCPCDQSSIGGTTRPSQGRNRPQDVVAPSFNGNAKLPSGQYGQNTGIYLKPQGGISVSDTNFSGATADTQGATGGMHGRPIGSSGSLPTFTGDSQTSSVNAAAENDSISGGPLTTAPGNIPTIGITVSSNPISGSKFGNEPGDSQMPGGMAVNSGNTPISVNTTLPNSGGNTNVAVSFPNVLPNLSGVSPIGSSSGGNVPVQNTQSPKPGGNFSGGKLPAISGTNTGNTLKPLAIRPTNSFSNRPSKSGGNSEQDFTGNHSGGSPASAATLPGGQSGTSGLVGEGRPHGSKPGNSLSESPVGSNAGGGSLPGSLSSSIPGGNVLSSSLPTGISVSLPVGNSGTGASDMPDMNGSLTGANGATTVSLPGGITAGSLVGGNAGGGGSLPGGLSSGSLTGGSGGAIGSLPGGISAGTLASNGGFVSMPGGISSGSLQGSSGEGSGMSLPGLSGGDGGLSGLSMPNGVSGGPLTEGSVDSGSLPGLSSSIPAASGSLPGNLSGSMSGVSGGPGGLTGLSSSLPGGSGSSPGLSLPGNSGGASQGLPSGLPGGGSLPSGLSGSLPGGGGSLPGLSLPGGNGVPSGELPSGLPGSGSLPSGLSGLLPGSGSLPGMPKPGISGGSSGGSPSGLAGAGGSLPSLPLPGGNGGSSGALPGGLPNLSGDNGGLLQGSSGGSLSGSSGSSTNSVPDSSLPGSDFVGSAVNTVTGGSSSSGGSGSGIGLPHFPNIFSGGLLGNSDSNNGNIKPSINITFSNHDTQENAGGGIFGSGASRPGGSIVVTVPGGQTYVHRFPMRSALPVQLTPSLSDVLENPQTEIVRLKRVDAEVSQITNYKISRFDKRKFMLKKTAGNMKDRVKRHGFKLRRFLVRSARLQNDRTAIGIPRIKDIPFGTVEKSSAYPMNSEVNFNKESKLRTRRHVIVPRSSVIQKIGSNPVEPTTASTTTSAAQEETTTESADCVVPVSQVCDVFDDIKDKVEGAKDLAETVGNVVFGGIGGGGRRSRGSGGITGILKGAASMIPNPFASNS